MLVLNDTGNLEIWHKRKKIWTTDTDDDYTLSLVLDNDGNINLLAKDDSSMWKSKTFATTSKNYLIEIQDDGNLVVENECGKSFWDSMKKGKNDTLPGKYFFIKI